MSVAGFHREQFHRLCEELLEHRLHMVHTAPGSVSGWLSRIRQSVEQILAGLPQG